MRHQLRNRPLKRKAGQQAHLKEPETTANQREAPANVAQRARREEGENNDISTHGLSSRTQTGNAFVDSSVGAGDHGAADGASNQWAENFRFIFGSRSGFGHGSSFGRSRRTRATTRVASEGANSIGQFGRRKTSSRRLR